MPRRNLFAIVIVALLAVLCHQRVQQNIYGRVLANAMAQDRKPLPGAGASLAVFEGAMDGMVGKLDDYSAYISPDELKQFHERSIRSSAASAWKWPSTRKAGN